MKRTPLTAMDLIGLKIFAGFALSSTAVLCGWIPLCVLRRYVSRNGKAALSHSVISLLHSCASGVLLATCLLDLLPEILHTLHSESTQRRDGFPYKYNTENTTGIARGRTASSVTGEEDFSASADYPVGELLIALGFIVTYVVDSVSKSWHDSRDCGSVQEVDHTASYCENGSSAPRTTHSSRKKETLELIPEEQKCLSRTNNIAAKTYLQIPLLSCDDGVNETSESKQQTSQLLTTSCQIHAEENHPLTDNNSPASATDKLSHNFNNLALVAALCVHGLFDGVLLGLQSSKLTFLSLLLALTLHKCFVSISLALTLLGTFYTQRSHNSSYNEDSFVSTEFISVLVFALTTPIGLIFSSILLHTSYHFSDSSSGANTLLPGYLQAFASGTLFYVTVSGLIQQSHHRHEERARPVLKHVIGGHISMICGFTLMACFTAIFTDT